MAAVPYFIILTVFASSACSQDTGPGQLRSPPISNYLENVNKTITMRKLTTTSSCSCDTCYDSQKIPAHGYYCVTLQCASGQAYVTSINAKSTDGSGFTVNTMADGCNSEQFYVDGGSGNQNVKCFQSGHIRVGAVSPTIVVKIACNNLIQSCPMEYNFEHGCTTPFVPQDFSGDGIIKWLVGGGIFIVLGLFCLYKVCCRRRSGTLRAPLMSQPVN